jgi:1-acyl-sn-glycerol-3-phosphate acyltransferase
MEALVVEARLVEPLGPPRSRGRSMAEAEIIPIGTRGRPGRGTGSSRPSASARSLAPGGAPKRTRPTAPGPRAEAPPEPDEATDPLQDETLRDPVWTVEGLDLPHELGRIVEQVQGLLGHGADPRHDGTPAADWLAALSSAARELFGEDWGEDWEERLADLVAFTRRRLEGDYVVDEYGFDAELTERFFLSAIRPVAEKWFRVEVRGAANIPTEGGALLVSNHSGTLPLDGLVTGLSVFDHTGRHLRALGADLVFRLPFVGEVARKGGATLACSEDAERMLCGGELVGVWPEGFKGIGKPYSERYKLQRFGRGGFVSAALRTGVPIIPCSVVGAEEIYPLVGNMPSLARLLGMPYIPVTPFFPWLGPLGLVPLPSKWIIEFGEPIRTDSYDDGAADDPMLVFNVTDQVRETIQQTLYSLLMQRRSVFS